MLLPARSRTELAIGALLGTHWGIPILRFTEKADEHIVPQPCVVILPGDGTTSYLLPSDTAWGYRQWRFSLYQHAHPEAFRYVMVVAFNRHCQVYWRLVRRDRELQPTIWLACCAARLSRSDTDPTDLSKGTLAAIGRARSVEVSAPALAAGVWRRAISARKQKSSPIMDRIDAGLGRLADRMRLIFGQLLEPVPAEALPSREPLLRELAALRRKYRELEEERAKEEGRPTDELFGMLRGDAPPQGQAATANDRVDQLLSSGDGGLWDLMASQRTAAEKIRAWHDTDGWAKPQHEVFGGHWRWLPLESQTEGLGWWLSETLWRLAECYTNAAELTTGAAGGGGGGGSAADGEARASLEAVASEFCDAAVSWTAGMLGKTAGFNRGLALPCRRIDPAGPADLCPLTAVLEAVTQLAEDCLGGLSRVCSGLVSEDLRCRLQDAAQIIARCRRAADDTAANPAAGQAADPSDTVLAAANDLFRLCQSLIALRVEAFIAESTPEAQAGWIEK